MARMINDKCMTCTDGDRTIAALQLRCSDYNMERREKNTRIAELETENARLKTTLERSDNQGKLVDAINAERWEDEILDDARSQDQWSADRTFSKQGPSEHQG